MPNKKMFNTGVVTKVPTANTVNRASGKAYSMTDEAALAQYVVTSCFNKTFYASEEEQVDKVLQLAQSAHNEFLAKCAVYGHEVAKMKDTPALLLAILAARSVNDLEARQLFVKIFPRVVTNGKMLFNFVQMVRSGVTGRKSFGTVIKRTIQNWLDSKTCNQLFTGSIGANPSLADVIKMVHPKPSTDERKNFYGYMIGRPYNGDSLPPLVQDFEKFKQARALNLECPVPNVPFQMLHNVGLTDKDWMGIARNMPWNALRMNLNTLMRHNVFKNNEVLEYVVNKLVDPNEVRRNNVFPYQLLASYINTTDVPMQVRNALQDAMEVATENVCDFGERGVAVCVDTSGSMSSPITGHRKGSTTKVRCIDVAALVGASLSRKNKNTLLLPFDTRVHSTHDLNPRDSIMTNAQKLARYGGGGTDTASALRVLNSLVGNRPNVIVYVSDMESWFNAGGVARYGYRYGGTDMAAEWENYKLKTPNAKLVLIDINANDTTQVTDSPNVLNIAGMSDKVWPTIQRFVDHRNVSFAELVKETVID